MTLSLLTKLAAVGIVKRRDIYFPYFLAVVLIMALEYIMVSLIFNDYVQSRHPDLPTIIMMAVFFSTLLAVIFILYANNFIQRQRRLEFSLYTVLGLESKHIRGVILIEQLMVAFVGSILSVGVGFAFGKLVFMGLSRLIQDVGAGLSDYPFSPLSGVVTTVILFAVMLFIAAINSLRLSRMNPSELLSQKNAGEAEPKSRWFILIIGLATLVAGYYVALTTTNVLDALLKIFVAIFLVVIATYALLTSLSIIVLKRMKKNENYYYQPVPFLSISGMLYRMKANATSLASIAILCTGIVLTLGTTLTLYLGMEEQVNKMTQYDVELNYIPQASNEDDASILEALNQLTSRIEGVGNVSDRVLTRTKQSPAIFSEGQYLPVDSSMKGVQWSYMIAQTLEDFNAYHQLDYALAEDEVLFVSSSSDQNNIDQLQLADQSYVIKPMDANYIPMNIVGKIVYVVFPSLSDLNSFTEAFPNVDVEGKPYEGMLDYTMYLNAADEESKTAIEAFIADNELIELDNQGLVRMVSSSQTAEELYVLNGGFLFLGIVVGIVLIIGTVLMLYFKQVSEGYQDQGKYEIMQKVGLSKELIKQTIHRQVFWIFALPIIIAVIHSLFASRIMFSLLGLLGVNTVGNFILGYGSILLVFVGIYFIFYLITSRAYYRIVNH